MKINKLIEINILFFIIIIFLLSIICIYQYCNPQTVTKIIEVEKTPQIEYIDGMMCLDGQCIPELPPDIERINK